MDVGPGAENIAVSNIQQSSQQQKQNNNNNNNSSVKSCAGCGGKICDRFLLHSLDRYWHTGCLKCSCCQANLADIGRSCFAKAGMILCKNDYVRLFGGGACTSCGQTIPANEFVMRSQGNVYHVKCFICTSCHCQLCPGDRYSVINGSLFCELDCNRILKGAMPAPPQLRNNKVC